MSNCLTLEVVVLLKGNKTAFHFILEGRPADGLWHQMLHNGGAEEVHSTVESADAPIKPFHNLLHALSPCQPPQHPHQLGVGADRAARHLEAHHFTQLLQTGRASHLTILQTNTKIYYIIYILYYTRVKRPTNSTFGCYTIWCMAILRS